MPEVRGKEKLVIQSLGMDGWNLPNKFLPCLSSATLPGGPGPCTASASMEKKDHSEPSGGTLGLIPLEDDKEVLTMLAAREVNAHSKTPTTPFLHKVVPTDCWPGCMNKPD